MSSSQISKNSDSEIASGRDGRESQDKEEVEDTVNTISSGKRIKCSICDGVLENCRPYYRRYRTCPDCASKDSVLIAGKPHRFCQQCGKFQERYLFDGATRTCRERLSRHAERRRNAAKRKREKMAKEKSSKMPQAEPLLEKNKVSNNLSNLPVVFNPVVQKSIGSGFRSLQPSIGKLQVANPMLYSTERRSENRPVIHRPKVVRFNALGPHGEEERERAHANLNQILDSLGIFKQTREEAGFALPRSWRPENPISSPNMPPSLPSGRYIPFQRDMGALEGDRNPAVPIAGRLSSQHYSPAHPPSSMRVAVCEAAGAEQPSLMENNQQIGDEIERQEEGNDQVESKAAALQLLEHVLGLGQGRIRDLVMKMIHSSGSPP